MNIGYQIGTYWVRIDAHPQGGGLFGQTPGREGYFLRYTLLPLLDCNYHMQV